VQWRIKIILNQVSCRNHGQKKEKKKKGLKGILSNLCNWPSHYVLFHKSVGEKVLDC